MKQSDYKSIGHCKSTQIKFCNSWIRLIVHNQGRVVFLWKVFKGEGDIMWESSRRNRTGEVHAKQFLYT